MQIAFRDLAPSGWIRITYAIPMMTPALHQSLIDAASAPYRAADAYAWRFARGKLKCDPAYRTLLENGLIPQDARLLDLGCGQGLLTAWLLAAREHAERGHWPANCPPPPRLASIQGVELMQRDRERAQKALGRHADFVQADIASADFGEADAVVILDVLHYIDYDAQHRILERVHAALPADGVLLLRIGNAAGGWRYKISAWYDRMVWKLRGARHSRLYCRTLDEWRATLRSIGFDSSSVPMREGLKLANVLLVAKPIGGDAKALAG
jgi:SAM-dependent methyltransferase